MAAEQKQKKQNTVKRLIYIDIQKTTTFLNDCAVCVAAGNKWKNTAVLQHCNSCSSFHRQLLYLSPISPCWCLPHSTQAKWGISMQIRGSLTRRPKETLLWNYDIKFSVSFVPLNCQYLAAKLARTVSSKNPCLSFHTDLSSAHCFLIDANYFTFIIRCQLKLTRPLTYPSWW